MPSFRDTTTNCRETIETVTLCIWKPRLYLWVSLYLRVSKVCAQHLSNVLGVRQVQGGVDLIQDVDGSGFEQKHGQDER